MLHIFDVVCMKRNNKIAWRAYLFDVECYCENICE